MSKSTVTAHMEKRFSKLRDEHRLPPKVLDELEEKVMDIG
ncbi:unnamed protein product, partial [marine sediment metagenome]